MSVTASLIEVSIAAVHAAAQDMKLFDFVTAPGAPLPPAEAGAHIDVHLPTGEVRQYSLVRPDATPRAYRIGVKREAGGKGASRWLHDVAQPGDALKISAPRNHFALQDDAAHSILIAGGIGVTPIWAMAQTLHARGASWELHYGVRSRAWCAFHAEMLALGGDVRFYFDDQPASGTIDLARLAAKAATGSHTHLYCCGPAGMLQAFEAATTSLPGRAHREHFSAPAASVPNPLADDGFWVDLARTKREVWIPAGKTVLDSLNALGMKIPFSCTQGVCGSCETRVLDGIPEHHDVILTQEERESNKTMMVCCSRAKSARLTLDL